MDSEALNEGTLQGYLRILGKRKLSVLVAVVLTVTAAYLYTHREAVLYESSTQLLLAPTPTQQYISGMTITYVQQSVPDQVEVITGNGVAALVAKKLGAAPPVTASELAQTDVMVVSAEAGNPNVAASIANAYANAYITYEQQTTDANLTSSTKILEQQLNTTNDQLKTAENNLASATKSGDTAGQAALQAKVSSLQNQVSSTNADINALGQAAEFGANSAQIINRAVPNPVPVQPNLKKNLLMGLVAGFVLGIGFVVAREYFDDTIRSEDELQLSLSRSDKTARFPILGAIPFGAEVLPGQAAGGGVVSLADPNSPEAESYRELRTSLQFLQVRDPVEVVLVTSPCGGEGKSTTVANLAVMLCRAGKSTALASLDLRRPKLHDYFGLGNDMGFTSVLLGESTLDDAIQTIEGVEGFGFLSAGPVPPNPAELLASPSADEIIARLNENYDVVLIDSPPVLRVTDGVVLSTLADTTLLVVRAGLTTRRDMVKSLDTIEQIGSPVAGLIVNAIPSELTYKDRYYYYSAYGDKRRYGVYSSENLALAGTNGNGATGNGSNVSRGHGGDGALGKLNPLKRLARRIPIAVAIPAGGDEDRVGPAVDPERISKRRAKRVARAEGWSDADLAALGVQVAEPAPAQRSHMMPEGTVADEPALRTTERAKTEDTAGDAVAEASAVPRSRPSDARLTFADDDPGLAEVAKSGSSTGLAEPQEAPAGRSAQARATARQAAAAGVRRPPPKKRGPVMRFLMGPPKKRPPQVPPGRRPGGR